MWSHLITTQYHIENFDALDNKSDISLEYFITVSQNLQTW